MIIIGSRIDANSGQCVCVEGRGQGERIQDEAPRELHIYNAILLKLDGMHMAICYIIFYTSYISKLVCNK